MAKKKSTAKKAASEKEWCVLYYTEEGLCAAVHVSDYSEEDSRVEKISEHDTHEEAVKAAGAFAKKKKITHQQ